MNEAEKWLRVWAVKPDSNLWKYASVYDLSRDFIREFKQNINWNKNTKKQLLERHGEEFYEELFGRRD